MLFRHHLNLALRLVLLIAAPAIGEVRVDVGNAVPNADGGVTIEVTLHTDGESVGAVQNDILFNHEALALDQRGCVIDPAIGIHPPTAPAGLTCFDDTSLGPCKTMHTNVIACRDATFGHGCTTSDGPDVSVFRAIIAATAAINENEIPNGAVLYTCTFRVLDAARVPQRLVNRNIVTSDPVGERQPEAGGSDGSVCLRLGDHQVCATRAAVGEPCAGSVDCLPNECDRTGGVCVPRATPTTQATKTPTPDPTATRSAPPGGRGTPCAEPADCRLGLLCNQTEGVCCNMDACPPGQSCRQGGLQGLCLPIVPTRTPTPTFGPQPLGGPCDGDDDCDSGSCVDAACCTQPRSDRQCESGACVDESCCLAASCAEGQRCDVPGFEGDCHAFAELGAACTDGAQCRSGFCADGFCCITPRCAFGTACETGVCEPVPPAGAPCAVDDECVAGPCSDGHCRDAASDQNSGLADDGCQLDRRAASPSGAWLVLAVSLLLLRMAQRQAHTRVIRRFSDRR